LLVPQDGDRIVHYFRDNDGDMAWHATHDLIFIASGPRHQLPRAVSMLQSNMRGTDGRHGTLWLAAWMQGSGGSTLDTWLLDSAAPPGGIGWQGPTQLAAGGQVIGNVTGF